MTNQYLVDDSNTDNYITLIDAKNILNTKPTTPVFAKIDNVVKTIQNASPYDLFDTSDGGPFALDLSENGETNQTLTAEYVAKNIEKYLIESAGHTKDEELYIFSYEPDEHYPVRSIMLTQHPFVETQQSFIIEA